MITAAPRAALLLAAFATLASTNVVHAQSLIGLDDGAPARLRTIDARFCDVPASCPLTDVSGAVIPSIPGVSGGVAVDLSSGARWFTTGSMLYRVRPDCSRPEAWSIAGLPWTGLALHAGRGLLYFTTASQVGQVPIPATGAGSVNMASAVLQPVVAPVTVPATGVEYDPDFDALWVCDANYGVSLLALPASGIGVLRHYNVTTYCGTLLYQPLEGITLDPRREVAGHSRGVLFVSDQSNRVLKMDRDGLEIGCCTVPGLAPALAGLAFLPAASSSRFGQGGHSAGGAAPRIGENGAPELGGGWSLSVDGALASALAVEFFDVDPFVLSLGWGTLYARPQPLPLPPLVIDGNGRASRPWALPLDPSLRGGVLRAQVLVLEPSGALALTEGLAITLR